MCARLVKKIWCDYIIDCGCYSEENKNRHNFLCATAWITIVAKSDVWIAITFSLLMQMPRFTYHFNSFNLLFKAIPNLVQNIAFEKNIPVPTYELFSVYLLVSTLILHVCNTHCREWKGLTRACEHLLYTAKKF